MNNGIEGILRGGQFKKLVETTMLVIKDNTGLKRVEVEVLYFLSRYPEKNTMKDICGHLQMNKGHISTVMDSLAKQEYIIQQKDENDRRYMHYFPTEKADEIIEKTTALWEHMMAHLTKNVTGEELAVFEKVAVIIGGNIEKMLNDTEWMK